ncbi:MAG: DUF2007 domain-containing protein [Gemmataceae bacterium]|nr:DUF2007 domain-containing protein [Gemmataceae bacterium]
MDHQSDDVVKVATGSLLEMNLLAEVLRDAGIAGRVVGDDLSAGLGTAMPESIELWVLAADATRAAEIIAADFQHHHRHRGEPAEFPRPESEPKPDRSQGPHHFPEPRRQSP